MRKEECAALDRELRALLGLAVPPIAIAFVRDAPADLPHLSGAMPVATPAQFRQAASSG
jgi:hypothetical protein